MCILLVALRDDVYDIMFLKVLVLLHGDYGIHNVLRCDAVWSSDSNVMFENQPVNLAWQ